MLKLSFLILLALNMTVICQEHFESDHLVGAHFIFSAPLNQSQLWIAPESQQSTSPVPLLSHRQIAAPTVPFERSTQAYSVQPFAGHDLESGAGVASAALLERFPEDIVLVRLLNIRGAVWTPLTGHAPAFPPPRPIAASIF